MQVNIKVKYVTYANNIRPYMRKKKAKHTKCSALFYVNFRNYTETFKPKRQSATLIDRPHCRLSAEKTREHLVGILVHKSVRIGQSTSVPAEIVAAGNIIGDRRSVREFCKSRIHRHISVAELNSLAVFLS